MADLNTSDHRPDKGGKSNIAAKFQYALTADFLPPIGVFWDIENCQVPKGRSAIYLVQLLRERFFKGHREAEFMCVCDISKERKEIISELNDAQVTVVHIIATSKNAADDKLKQCMRRFVDIHGCPSTVVLITSDVNFTTDLSDFRYRRKIRVILIHGDHAPEPLLACAHEHFRFEELTSVLPYRSPAKAQGNQRSCELLVTDIPINRDVRQIQNRLRRLSDNCGGKVVTIQGSTAVIRFSNPEAAQRARKRMDKEDVFGSKISVTCGRIHDTRESSPYFHTSRSRQSSNGGGSSRDSSPVLAELNQILQRQRSLSETGLSQESLDIAPPPPDLIRQGPSSQSLYSNFSSLEIKNNCDKGPSAELKTIITHIKHHQVNRSWNSSPLGEGETRKTNQKNIGRVSPFLMTDPSASTSMASPQCHNTKFQLFPVEQQSANYGMPHAFRIPNVPSNTGFFPINQHTTNTPSPTPLYTWNPASLVNQDTFRPPSVRSISPVPPLVTYPAPASSTTMPVELLVTNLDQNIEANEMKRILLSAFREHVMVLHVSILLQPDGTLKAIIKVPSSQDAQLAISQLHRRKIGFKRILISYTSNERSPPLNVLKYEVINLLSDVPTKGMPLFKFRELFENRYHRSIGTCDLYKLKDIVHVTDEKSGRMVCFHPNYRSTPSPVTTEGTEAEGLEKSYCQHHSHFSQTKGWAESDNVYPLPNVHISLKSLSPKVHTLLDSHQGSLPLNSFCDCYEAEFGDLPLDLCHSSSAGVPLEHLITCIPGVQITKSALGVKGVQWLQNKDLQGPGNRNISPSLVGQVYLFSREVVDLLKNHPHCSIQFHKFIPLYHHHFGRQCRVSDYGYTKLLDLLEAIPHIVQILGHGQNRVLTLTHRSQMKRFASDLLRVLKSRPSKQLSLGDLPEAYEKCLGKKLDITHYGICVLEDIVSELSDNSVVVTQVSGETYVSIPKREQTSEEMERTREFSQEVIVILSHIPSCSMLFNKFVPAYHHHFGKQCKVADFGFSKLIELFEAIPNILEISGSGEDKVVFLTPKEKLSVLGQRMVSLVCSVSEGERFLPLDDIEATYMKVNGYPLRLQEFGLNSYVQMAETLQHCVKLEKINGVQGLVLVDQEALQRTKLQLQCLLMENPTNQVTLMSLRQLYQTRFKSALDPGLLAKCLDSFVKLEKDVVQLTPLQLLFRHIIQLLQENMGQLAINSIQATFLNRFGVPCQPALYNFQTLNALLASAPEFFTIKGKKKKTVHINQSTTCIPQLATSGRQSKLLSGLISSEKSLSQKHGGSVLDLELLIRASPLDLMSQPIPSSVPSPELEPEHEPVKNKDLMGFESPMPISNDIITGPGLEDPVQSHCSLIPYSSLYLGPSLASNIPSQGQTMGLLFQQPLPFHFAQPPLTWLSSASSARGSAFSSPKSQHANSQSASRENLSMESSLNGSGMSSAQDTPTRRSKRNRIAAHFPVH